MRIIIALVAVAAAAFCGYQLLTMPVDGSIVASIAASTDPAVHYETIGLVASLAVLAVLACKRARVIHEEKRIEDIREFVASAIPTLEKYERRHSNLTDLKITLDGLQSRLAPLTSPTEGLGAALRHCNMGVASVTETLTGVKGEFTHSGAESVIAKARSAGDDIASLEGKLKQIEELAASTGAFSQRLALLSGPEGLVAQLVALRGRLDGIGDIDQILNDIEAGDQDQNGDLSEQIEELGQIIKDAVERMDALNDVPEQLQRLRQRLAAAGGAHLASVA